jgi:hypothetical protein
MDIESSIDFSLLTIHAYPVAAYKRRDSLNRGEDFVHAVP